MELTKHTLIHKLLNTANFASNLDTVKAVIHTLNLNPTYPIILIGGTNGKGSTCAYLSTILTQAGYTVGSFTSPHLFEYNERITINTQPIDDLTLVNALNTILNQGKHNLGLFKTFTLAAHLIFSQKKVDIAIIEVGIGGKNDATNLFEPTISAITNVDFDHCEILGNSLNQIGKEKAGIFRTNKWAFVGSLNAPTTIHQYAKEINAKLQLFATDFGVIKHEYSFEVWCQERKFYGLPYPNLRGDEQINNVALALAILSKLNDFPLSLAAIKTALLQIKLVGRFQLLPGVPQILLDVAHNPQAVAHLCQNMLKLPFVKNNYAVFGIAKEKDAAEIIKLGKNIFNKWFIANLNSSRSQEVQTLYKLLIDNGINKDNVIQCKNIAHAYQEARKITSTDDRITCFGSFLVVEEAYNAIHNKRS